MLPVSIGVPAGYLQRHSRPNAAQPPPIQPGIKAQVRKTGADHGCRGGAAAAARRRRPAPVSGLGQAGQDQVADLGGVGLAAGGLHDRADQDPDRGNLSAADLRRDIRVSGDGLVDRGLQRAVVTDHDQATRLDHIVRGALAGQYSVDHLAGQPVVQRAGQHQVRDPGHLIGRNREGGQHGAGLVRAAGQLAQPPLPGVGRGRARGYGTGYQVERVRVAQRGHIGVGQVPLGLEPFPPRRGQLGQRPPDLLHPLGRGRDRHQIRLGEVAVVLRLLLAAAEAYTDASGRATTVAKLDNTGVNGTYLTSEGKKGDAAWGTRGRWCNLSGLVGDEPVTITILDHPENPGFPTYWHARGYGLFAANPLGQKVFSNGKEELNFSLAPHASVTFRYRILISSAILTLEATEAAYKDFVGTYH